MGKGSTGESQKLSPAKEEFARWKLKKQQEKRKERHPESSEEESESELETFIDTSSQSSRKRKKQSSEEDSDQEPDRPPLADSVHANRQQARQDRRNTMPKKVPLKMPAAKKKAPKNKGTKRNSEESNADPKGSGEKQSGQPVRNEELYREQMRYSVKANGWTLQKSEAMEGVVAKITKRELWKVCKFVKNEGFLQKATNFVMHSVDPTEFENLEGNELIERQEMWKATYSSTVREALNKFRNYVQGEIRKVVYEDLISDQPRKLPDKQEILQLATRDKLDEDTPEDEREEYEKLFDVYWTVLLPKVAGNSYWGPSRKLYYRPSSSWDDRLVPEGSPLDQQVPLVSAEDEAFLVVTYLNAYDKWTKQAAKHKASVEERKVNPKAVAYDPKNDKEDYNLPYTNAKAGNKKFGGWREEGINRYDGIVDLIKRNREENREYIKAVEEEALKRIQKVAGIIKENEGLKKKAIGSESGNPFANVDPGKENDFSTW